MNSKFNKLIWALNSFFVFWSCTRSLINFLFGLQQISANNIPVIFLTLAEFVNLTLAGWLFFNFYARPGTLSLIPSEEIRNDKEELFRMWNYAGIVYALRTTFYAFALTYAEINTIEILDLQIEPLKILYISAPVLVITIARLTIKRRLKTSPALLADELLNLSIQERASKKILSLNHKEQQELSLLVFQSQKLSRLTIQSLAYTIWLSLVIAFALQVAEEFFIRF